MEQQLTHLNVHGRAKMVVVYGQAVNQRIGVASGRLKNAEKHI